MAAPAALATSLLVTGADGPTSTYALGPTPLTIGRHPANAVVLADATVSTYHAQIVIASGRAAIVDVGSLNGTYVNGRQLGLKRPWPLQPSDVVEIGRY